MKRKRRTSAVIFVHLCLLIAATGWKDARSQTPPESAGDQMQEIIVTGSRIVGPNATSASPIQVVTAKEIRQGGKTDIIDLVNQLPQNFQSVAADFSNTSSGLTTPGGITTADLRGLGPQRTLVLINGRRLGTGDPNTANPNSAPDLDQIPVALVERVDVVTGGASAVYGSDAVAGVVNFIMKRDFQGIQFDGQLGEYWHTQHNSYVQGLLADKGFEQVSGSRRDGRGHSINMLLGTNFADGAGNITGYLGYLKANPVASGDRDFGACQLNLTAALRGVRCGGSTSSNLFSTADGTPYTVVGNQFLPWPQAGSDPPAEFNSQRYIFASRGDERYTAGFMGHLDINAHAAPYAELGFMSDRTSINVAPSGLFQGNPIDPTGNGNFNINCSNPLLSAQQASIICTPAQIAADQLAPGCPPVPNPPPANYVSPNCANINIGRRNVEGGGREAFWDHTNYRAVLGIRGEVAGGWSYDAYGQYYYTSLFNSNDKYLNFQAVANALQVTGTAANPVCVSGPPCVPWNIFSTGGVTADQVNSLYTTGTSYGSVTERILHADVTGDLGRYGLKLPTATEGIGVNIGFEHRNEKLRFKPDSGELSGLLSGFGGASVAIDNGYSLKEGFVEVRVPLVQDRPGVKDLQFDAGFRHSDYQLAGGVNTFKFDLQYAPNPDVRFRGSYQRAIRAPNIIELFTPQSFGLIGSPGIDPCAPTRDPNTGAITPATASLVECQRTGVTAAQYGNGGSTNSIKQCVALQCGQLQGGNVGLKPEQADSISLGLSFQPAALPNLSGSVDYYRIKIKDEVGVASAALVLQQCLSGADPASCSAIVRTQNGSLAGSSVATGGYIVQTGVNIGAAMVEGIDVQATYKLRMSERLGSLLFNLSGAELLKSTTTPSPGAHTYDCAGLYGATCATVNPKWRHNLRISWLTPWNLEVSAFWRYIGKVSLDTNSQDPSLSNGNFDAFDARLAAHHLFDLSASWMVTKELELRAGANNIFDRDPPVVSANVSASGAANSFPTYDQLGRQLFIAFTAKF
jgi:iron complex outermembrane recepter protein